MLASLKIENVAVIEKARLISKPALTCIQVKPVPVNPYI